MKMDFPQVDLPTEVLAWTNVTEDILNIYKQSCRLQACIVAPANHLWKFECKICAFNTLKRIQLFYNANENSWKVFYS